MLQKYLPDYYMLKVSMKDICKKENISGTKFYSELNKMGLLSTRVWYGQINTGIKELDRMLKGKYASIVKRCNGSPTYIHAKSYIGKDYMPIYEWVKYCNENKSTLVMMWNNYTQNKRKPRFAISIDRINNNRGYNKDNVQFTTYGFNSWKRNIRPVAVIHKGKTNYFMSCEEASRYYDIRRQTIGDILRGVNRRLADEFEVEDSTVNNVLEQNGVSSLQEYYNKVFER